MINAPILTVDAIIIYEGKIVMVKRKYHPFEGMFALPGGHVDEGETVEEATVREAKEETGLDIDIIKLHGVYSKVGRDPRGHYVTICYIATGKGNLNAGSDAKEIGLFTLSSIPELAFDHNKIINDARDKIRDKMKVWVQDVNEDNALDTLFEIEYKNSDYCNRTGSIYVFGKAKSNLSNELGIYFIEGYKKNFT